MMKLLRYITFAVSWVFYSAACFGQSSIPFTERSKIDSLKTILLTLKDSARVDCLNELSIRYCYLNKKDSAELYVTIALEEAENLNYIHEIAESFACKAFIKEDLILPLLKQKHWPVNHWTGSIKRITKKKLLTLILN